MVLKIRDHRFLLWWILQLNCTSETTGALKPSKNKGLLNRIIAFNSDARDRNSRKDCG